MDKATQLPLFSADAAPVPADAKADDGDMSEFSGQGEDSISWKFYPGDDALF